MKVAHFPREGAKAYLVPGQCPFREGWLYKGSYKVLVLKVGTLFGAVQNTQGSI